MKPNTLRVSVLIGFASILPGARGQTGTANVYFGLGTAIDSSAQTQIDTFSTGKPYTTPKMAGLFGDLGASYMFTPHYGVGADFDWRATRAAYAGLNYRPAFYNFDAIYEPGHSKRFEPEVRAGLGGVNLSYGYSSTACDALAGCSTSNQYIESAHHFQVHMELAARYYVTSHVFLRPAAEAHWVNNFSQFGSNWVPQYSMGVGYTFGTRE